MTKPARKGAGTDEPTGPMFGDSPNRTPVAGNSSCTGSYKPRRIDSYGESSASSSRSRCGGGAEAVAGANGDRNKGRKRGLAPDPTGEAAPLGASSENAVAVRLAVGAVCCGAAGCRRSSRLVSVTVDVEKRVLCAVCSAEFIRRECNR